MSKSDFIFYKIGGYIHLAGAGLIIGLYKYGHYMLAAAIGFAIAITWYILLTIAYSAIKKRTDAIEEELRK